MAKRTLQTANEEWDKAISNLKEAEKKAGVDAAVQDLYGRLQRGPDQTSEYRKIIFGIHDLELRKQVIFWDRECLRLVREVASLELCRLRQQVHANSNSIRNREFWHIAFVGVMAIAVGDALDKTRGSLIGAVLSLLYGFRSILQAEHKVAEFVASQKDDINEQEKLYRSLLSTLDTFSLMELETGQKAT